MFGQNRYLVSHDHNLLAAPLLAYACGELIGLIHVQQNRQSIFAGRRQ